MAEDGCGPGIGGNDPGQHPGCGGLAGTVRAEKAEDLALLDVEIDTWSTAMLLPKFFVKLKHELRLTQAPHLLIRLHGCQEGSSAGCTGFPGSHPFLPKQDDGV